MENLVYLNGKMVPRSKATLSINDHGLLYSYGLFQTMRAYNGKLFLLDRHMERLHDAAKVIKMEEKLGGIDFASICRETLAVNKLRSARMRLTVTGGDADVMPWLDNSGSPTIMITAVPYTPLPESKYLAGYKVGIASVRRMKQSPLSAIKSISYLLNVVARLEASQKSLDETILLNEEGHIAEGGGSNIFFVKDGKLVTPSLNSGIIPGVTREAVIAVAGGLGIDVREGPVGIGAIRNSAEIFMTNAVIEVMPVVSVEDESGNVVTIGGGIPGRITQKLMAAYREKVVEETGA